MFRITDVFHITHVVDDLDGAVDWYEDVFSPIVFQRTEVLNNSLALMVIGDVVLMPLQPGSTVPTPAAGFRAKFGQHLHSLAVHVQDPEDFMAHMESLGHSLSGARGGAVEGPGDEIWTKPRDFPGLYELWAPRIEEDPRLVEGWSSAFWRDEHPLGLVGPAWVTVVTDDRTGRSPGLATAFRAPIVHESPSTPCATESTFLELGSGVVLEVAQPTTPDGAAAVDLGACGEILHAVTFEVADAERAAVHLAQRGLEVEQPGRGVVTVNPNDALGVRFRFTEGTFSDW